MSFALMMQGKRRVALVALTGVMLVGGTLGYALPRASAQAATLDHVSITPANPSVQAGATVQFTGTGFDASNAIINSGVTYVWAVVAGGGTISDVGLFTAGATTGTYANTVQLTAAQGAITKTATATVTVTAPATLDHVSIVPANPTIQAGKKVQFTGTAFDAVNAVISSGVTYAWAVTAGGGTINATGLFTAGATAGTYANTVQLTATQGTVVKTVTASVTVTERPGSAEKERAGKVRFWHAIYQGILKSVGFRHFVKSDVTVLNDAGQEVVHSIVAGVVKEIGTDAFAIDPNGSQTSARYTVTAETLFIPGHKQGTEGLATLKIDDAVMVGLNDGKVIAVTVIPPGQPKREDKREEKERLDERREAINAQIKAIKAEMEKRIAELRKQLAEEKKDRHEQVKDRKEELRERLGELKDERKQNQHDDRDDDDDDDDD